MTTSWIAAIVRRVTIMALTDTAILTAKLNPKSRKIFDGCGLYLLLNSNSVRHFLIEIYPDNTAEISAGRAREARKF
jgi:hypothetical protein